MIACGIDIGTTNLKVVLVDDRERVLAQLACPTPRADENGAAVTDPGELLATIEAMLVSAWRQSGSTAPLAAIATAGVGEDGFLVDAQLRPLTRAIPWFDRRASAEAEELEAAHSAQALTGLTFEPTRTAPKWLWLSRNRPQSPDGTWIALTDYPLSAWSGMPFMSETLAARTACYDVTRRAWINALLSASCAPALPPVLPAATIVGRMRSEALVSTGVVSEQTALVTGGHDHPVAASFIRRHTADAIVDSLGTAELVYAETHHYDPLPGTGLVHSPAILKYGGQALTYVFELARTIKPITDLPGAQALLDAASDAPGLPPRDPWLPNEAAIAELPARLEADASDRLSITRSVLEGCAFVTRSVIEEMRTAGDLEGTLYSSGGRSRSDPWMRFRANAIGQPIHRIAEEEQAALGAAIIAMSAVGHRARPSPSAIARFEPNEMAAGYTSRFQPLATAFRRLREPLLQRTS